MSNVNKNFRLAVFKRDGFVCKKCGVKGTDDNKLTVHHIKPLTNGGRNIIDNLVTLCEKCHKNYHIKYGADFYKDW